MEWTNRLHIVKALDVDVSNFLLHPHNGESILSNLILVYFDEILIIHSF